MEHVIRLIRICIVLMLFSVSAKAQDIILTSKGDIIMAKVLEVNANEVVFKMYDNPDGPTRRMAKSEISRINYVNGQEDVFSKPSDKGTAKDSHVTVETPAVEVHDEGYLYYGNAFLVTICNGKGEKVNRRLDEYLTASEIRELKTHMAFSNFFRVASMASFVPLGIGLGMAIYDSTSNEDHHIRTKSWLIAGGGLGLMVGCVIAGVSADAKGMKILKSHNASSHLASAVYLGGTPSGIGLTYSF